jgi:spermidine synthase
MNRSATALLRVAGGLAVGLALAAAHAEVIFEKATPYHNIQVLDDAPLRILSFDGAQQTRMALHDPLSGHFEYTEFFHMPWLWNTNLTNILMVGLGGGSAQRSFAYYYPDVTVETVEIDPTVLQVAQDYFHFRQSPRQRVHVADGRVFLGRVPRKFDALCLDAYAENRYGSFVPRHLATKEFFELAHSRLSTNGVLAYNVIGKWRSGRSDLVGALYKTLQSVFPQVYAFTAGDSENVVLLAAKWPHRFEFNTLNQRASLLISRGRVTLPTFRSRLYAFRAAAPPSLAQSPVLTDDFAPVEGLIKTEPR